MRRFYFLLLLCATMPVLGGNNLWFTHIGVEKGLSQMSVNSIYQDEWGRMWFATRQGLNCYDGSDMRVFLADDADGLLDNLVLHVTGDGCGHVFILTQQGLNSYDLQQRKMSVISRRSFSAIQQGAAGLWLASGRQVYKCQMVADTLLLMAELPDAQAEIVSLCEMADGTLTIGTRSQGVWLMDENGKMRCILDVGSQVSDIFEDSRHNLWVGTWHHGLFCLRANGTWRRFTESECSDSLSSNFVRTLCEDNLGHLWIGTKKGLDRLNTDGSFTRYTANQFQNTGLSNESVWALCCDAQGSIWVGTYFGGIDFFNPETDYYTFHELRTTNRNMPVIGSVVEDANGLLYLCTEGDGLWIYNPKTGSSSVYNLARGNAAGLRSDNIKKAYLDTVAGALWLGTYLGGLSRFDLHTHHFTHYKLGSLDWMQGDHVRGILPLPDGQMLIGTYSGIYKLNPSNGTTQPFDTRLNKCAGYCADMQYDHSGHLWIGGNGLVKYDLKTGDIQRYVHLSTDSNSLSNNSITRVFVDSEQRVWVGTDGGGLNLYQPKTDTWQRYNVHTAGLQNDFVSNVAETPMGYLLVTTTQGFAIINPVDGRLRNYGRYNGLPLTSLFNGGLCVTRQGDIVLAGMDGMVSFREEDLVRMQRPVHVYFSGLKINNRPVLPADATRLLTSDLPYTETLRLSAKQNILELSFATDNYISINQPTFRYRLQGFSDAWVDLPQGKRELQFMNLKHGRYRLTVQALSSINGDVLDECSLSIRMRPPLYATWWAILLYLCVAAFLVWRWMLFLRSRERLRTSLRYERQAKQQADAVNQSKLRFFTNISHEFRTPLTLIVGQIDMLLQMPNVSPNIYNRILNMRRNAVNMQALITELLEFRKYEQGHLQLKVSQQDAVRFVHEIFWSFSEYAAHRNINFRFECHENDIPLWFDPMQMQKVFYNLISNAFKYTPQGGSIRVSIEELPDAVLFRMSDSGVGISSADVKRIFDRFYQAENGIKLSNVAPGTGIGLALTKGIVEMHGATISVDSQANVGSVFCVRMKKGDAHFSAEQKCSVVEQMPLSVAPLPADDEFMRQMAESRPADAPRPTILIVEDNEELRQMLAKMFEPIYHVQQAIDGQDGYEKALEVQPDLILSDVMMPRLSGNEMCAKIKANFDVSHIPVVLLTAQTAVEYTIEGLRLGADDYITKPFNVKVLVTRCNNLVNSRRLLQERFGHQVDFRPSLVATNTIDQTFLEKAHRIVEANLDNSEFDVPQFCREIGMGRTNLFAKIKGITGQTPNEFIVSVRLKKAAYLLQNNPELNISDITYSLGFSSPKYFAKCFRQQFGKAPSEYRKQKEDKE